jgi:hypothetical protein
MKHVIVNLDKKEYIDPERFGDGDRMLDFVAIGGALIGLALLLAWDEPGDDPVDGEKIAGRWADNRIVIAGSRGKMGMPFYVICTEPDTGWVDISPQVLRALIVRDPRLRRDFEQRKAGRWEGDPIHFALALAKGTTEPRADVESL